MIRRRSPLRLFLSRVLVALLGLMMMTRRGVCRAAFQHLQKQEQQQQQHQAFVVLDHRRSNVITQRTSSSSSFRFDHSFGGRPCANGQHGSCLKMTTTPDETGEKAPINDKEQDGSSRNAVVNKEEPTFLNRVFGIPGQLVRQGRIVAMFPVRRVRRWLNNRNKNDDDKASGETTTAAAQNLTKAVAVTDAAAVTVTTVEEMEIEFEKSSILEEEEVDTTENGVESTNLAGETEPSKLEEPIALSSDDGDNVDDGIAIPDINDEVVSESKVDDEDDDEYWPPIVATVTTTVDTAEEKDLDETDTSAMADSSSLSTDDDEDETDNLQTELSISEDQVELSLYDDGSSANNSPDSSPPSSGGDGTATKETEPESSLESKEEDAATENQASIASSISEPPPHADDESPSTTSNGSDGSIEMKLPEIDDDEEEVKEESMAQQPQKIEIQSLKKEIMVTFKEVDPSAATTKEEAKELVDSLLSTPPAETRTVAFAAVKKKQQQKSSAAGTSSGDNNDEDFTQNLVAALAAVGEKEVAKEFSAAIAAANVEWDKSASSAKTAVIEKPKDKEDGGHATKKENTGHGQYQDNISDLLQMKPHNGKETETVTAPKSSSSSETKVVKINYKKAKAKSEESVVTKSEPVILATAASTALVTDEIITEELDVAVDMGPSIAPGRSALAAPGVDLAGKWDLIVTDDFKKEYDKYLEALGQPFFVRSVALSIVGMTTEETVQSDDGRKLLVRGRNIQGTWERTYTASDGILLDDDVVDATDMMEAVQHERTPVRTADDETVLAEAWWEECGSVHRSWMLGVKKYGGGDFESRRYLLCGENQGDDDIYVCESTFHPANKEKRKASVTWRFKRQPN